MATQLKKASGKSVAHPCAHRSGAGPPIAPPAWGWTCGQCVQDMVFTSPCRKRFRSRVTLDSFLKGRGESNLLSQFEWKPTSSMFDDFKRGGGPGNCHGGGPAKHHGGGKQDGKGPATEPWYPKPLTWRYPPKTDAPKHE